MKKTKRKFIAANENAIIDNVVVPFIIADSEIRGRFLRLGSQIDVILSNHNYPPLVLKLLAQLVMISVMLGSLIKLKGSIYIQIRGDGPVKLMIADYNDLHHIRGYAQIDEEAKGSSEILTNMDNENNIANIFGNAQIIITIEQEGFEKPYQAIIAMDKPDLQSCIVDYYLQSVQIKTNLFIKVENYLGRWHAGGLILQNVPQTGGNNNKENNNIQASFARKDIEEIWQFALYSSATITDKECFDVNLSPGELLYRLYSEYGVRVFSAQKVKAKCRCSRQKMFSALKSIAYNELEELAVNNIIGMDCHFCSRKEEFFLQELKE